MPPSPNHRPRRANAAPATPERAIDAPSAEEQAGAPPALPLTARAVRERQAETLRSSLRTLADSNGLTLAGLARRLGLKNANLLYNLLNGHSSSLSQDTLARLCAAFPGITLEALIGGRAGPGTPATATGPVPPQAGADEAGTPAPPGTAVAAATTSASPRASVPPRRDSAVGDPLHALSMSLHGLRGALMAVERMCRQACAALEARDLRL
jgi:hypothetical protein